MRFVYKLALYFSNLTFSSKNTRFLKLARYYYTRPPTTYTDARIWIHTQISLLLLLLLLQSDFRWISTFVAIPLYEVVLVLCYGGIYSSSARSCGSYIPHNHRACKFQISSNRIGHTQDANFLYFDPILSSLPRLLYSLIVLIT